MPTRRLKPQVMRRHRLSASQVDELRAQLELVRSAHVVQYLDAQIAVAERRLDQLNDLYVAANDEELRLILIELAQWRMRRRTLVEIWEYTTDKVRRSPGVEG